MRKFVTASPRLFLKLFRESDILKKFSLLFAILLILSVIFSSCEGPEFIKDFIPEKSFTVHMIATKGDKNFEADIICLNNEDITISFTYPEELSGFSVKTSEDGYTVNIFGVPDEVTESELNDNSLLNVLIETVRLSVFSNHGFFTKQEDFYEANLSVDSVPVYVKFGKDGYISEMKADTLDFYGQFQYFS